MHDDIIFPGQYHPSLGHYLWINLCQCPLREKSRPAVQKQRGESLRFFSSYWRAYLTQREKLVLTALGCFSQVWAEHWWLSGLSEDEWGNCTDGLPGRPNVWDWRGLRDWNGEPAWAMTSHLENTDVGLSCGHVEGCEGTLGRGGDSDKERWPFKKWISADIL